MRIHSFQFGQTVTGKTLSGVANVEWPLDSARPSGPCTLILGGIHGDEPATIRLLEEFAASDLPQIPDTFPTLIVSCCNPDGFEAGTRYNANRVDLNRNFPWRWNSASVEPAGSMPLSEPESQALHRLILQIQPRKIMSLHWALAELDADGPQSKPLLDALWSVLNETEKTAYRCRLSKRTDESEYAGSLGQWCGFGVSEEWGWAPAMVTLELPAEPLKPRQHPLPPDHLQIVQDRWKHDSNGYLLEVGPSVRKMLGLACTFPMVL